MDPDASYWCTNKNDGENAQEVNDTIVAVNPRGSSSSESDVSNSLAAIVDNEPSAESLKEDKKKPKKKRGRHLRSLYIKLAKSSSDSIPLNKSSQGSIEDPMRRLLYITSYKTNDVPAVEVTLEKFKHAIKGVVNSKPKLTQVQCGILAVFSNNEDADNVIKMNVAKIFGGPVQIANLSSHTRVYKRAILFRDIPWCISELELGHCLDKQRIHYGKISRVRTFVRVEVLNSSHVDRLLQEGLNFYNCVSFSGTLETTNFSNYTQDIIQCYKCQGFWHTANHCKHALRCVRCGDHHEVEYCPRPKNNPICCNCHGAHHAAYKLCPTRLKLLNSVNVAISYTNRQKGENY